MSEESEPIAFSPRRPAATSERKGPAAAAQSSASGVFFTRRELNDILAVYGRKVAAGEWRDYALDMGRDKAVFCVFRRTSEYPLYRIEKNPRLARRQGAYAVISATGMILKRGPDLRRVLQVLDKHLQLIEH